MEQGFIVEFEPAGNRQRADGLLDFPASGQEHEAFGEIWPFDHLDDPICSRLHGLDEKRLVAAIDDYGFNPRAKADQPLDQRDAAVLIPRFRGGRLWTLAGVIATASSRPPLSTAIWRLRPSTFLPAS